MCVDDILHRIPLPCASRSADIRASATLASSERRRGDCHLRAHAPPARRSRSHDLVPVRVLLDAPRYRPFFVESALGHVSPPMAARRRHRWASCTGACFRSELSRARGGLYLGSRGDRRHFLPHLLVPIGRVGRLRGCGDGSRRQPSCTGSSRGVDGKRPALVRLRRAGSSASSSLSPSPCPDPSLLACLLLLEVSILGCLSAWLP